MTHTYKISGMTCKSCEEKVKSSLLLLPEVLEADVSKENGLATITMSRHIALSTLQKALDSKYTISTTEHSETLEQTKNWLATYKPILLIFIYITIVSLLTGIDGGRINVMQSMNVFMAGFFLTFSFFKFLDLKGFSESYQTYDIVAKKVPVWGYLYAFVEFGLGIAYLTNAGALPTNLITFVIMTISLIGVLQSVLNKRKIRCACLGTVFNLPMSTVTIVEDALMIVMSGIMIAFIL